MLPATQYLGTFTQWLQKPERSDQWNECRWIAEGGTELWICTMMGKKKCTQIINRSFWHQERR